jgi:predicted MFS family arabinose efflux permease
MDFMVIMPLGPQLMRIFSITPAQFGFLVSSYTFAGGLFGLIGALFIDRFDRKKALLFSFLGFIAGTFACSVAPGYEALLISRCITGSFGGILGSLVLSVVGDLIPMERRAAAMGKVMMGFSVASVLGVPFGLYLANLFGWHITFVFLGCISLPVAFGIIRFMPAMDGHMDHGSEKVNAFRALISILSDRNHQFALSVMFTLMFAQFFIVPFISPYMVANAGMKEGELPFIYMFGGLATMVMLPWTGRLADKYGRLRVFTIFSISSLAVILVLTHLPPVPVYVALTVTTLFFISVSSRGVAATTMISTAVNQSERGRFMSLNAAVQQISAGLASWIGGFVIVKLPDGSLGSYGTLGWMAVGSGLVCLALSRQIKARS